MASQKMALLAVAAGLLCISALLNGAEASVSAGHQRQFEIDIKYPNSILFFVVPLMEVSTTSTHS
jgi:hypothetical protein